MLAKFKTIFFYAAILLGPVLATLSVQADVYRWVDAHGVVHYSDKPPQAEKEKLQVETQPDAPPNTYRPPEGPEPSLEAGNSAKPRETEPAVKVKAPLKVELYVTSWCKYCKMAQAFLRKNNIPFSVYDIEKDAAAAKRRQAIDPRPGVPLAVIDGKVLLGFSEAAYRYALDLDP